jgi:hypothetical protein
MVENATEPNRLIDSIPRSEEIRERLGAALREVHILRQLLKVAERAEKNKKEAARA